jgi:hypothetical protein
MTHATDGHPSETDDAVVEDEHEHEDFVAQEVARDDVDGPEDREAPNDSDDPDEESVRRLLAGPQSPEGKIEVAAAGIDVAHQDPQDETDDHLREDMEDDAAEHPAEAYVEEGNRWSGDGPVSTAGLFLTPDPSHPESADLVVVSALPETPVEAASAAGLPVVREKLLTADAEQVFLSRWNEIQIGFVEDPAQSVRDADALIEDIASAYVNAFGGRRDELAADWQEGDPGTEELRLALRRYRSFIGVVLPK